jgi:hypothetical protein
VRIGRLTELGIGGRQTRQTNVGSMRLRYALGTWNSWVGYEIGYHAFRENPNGKSRARGSKFRPLSPREL